jgi:hydroxymethylpyrimidine/phosphomethylpyrimidine kinase
MTTTPAGPRTAVALTIAGSDSSGGAGIQADLKTFSAFGVYGASVITALTAQNTRGVQAVETVQPAFVIAQLDAVLSDLEVAAAKTGMLATSGIVSAVAARLKAPPRRPLVVDPVMVATSGDVLLDPEAIDTIKRDLIPLATLITPNLPEAARLLGAPEAQSETAVLAQAKALYDLGCSAVLVKGGHGSGEMATDYLYDQSGIARFALQRIETPHTHGTGCVLSAAITALLAQGAAMREAIARAKAFVWQGLQHGQTLGLGRGRGPVDPLFAIRKAPPPA